MKTKKFVVPSTDGPVTVTARISDDEQWAYHKCLGTGAGYTVTHIPSGHYHSTGHGWQRARAWVKVLGDIGVKWNGEGRPSEEFERRVTNANI
jgi:hypothetical protein